jgi:hypothetical protein
MICPTREFPRTVSDLEAHGCFDLAEEIARNVNERDRLAEINKREDTAEWERRKAAWKTSKNR